MVADVVATVRECKERQKRRGILRTGGQGPSPGGRKSGLGADRSVSFQRFARWSQKIASSRGNSSYSQSNHSGVLTYALIFAICALIFGALGFRGAASGFATIARVLLAIFLILFVLTLLFGNRFFHA